MSERFTWYDQNEKGQDLILILKKHGDLYLFQGKTIDGVIKVLSNINGRYVLELQDHVLDYPLVTPILKDINANNFWDVSYYFEVPRQRIKQFLSKYFSNELKTLNV